MVSAFLASMSSFPVFNSSEIIFSQEAMENFVFHDEIKTKFMEANCFVKNASLLTFDTLKIFIKRFTFT